MFPTFKLINGVKTWTNSHWATTSLIKGKKGREFLKSITTDFTQPHYVNIFNIYLYNILNANQTSKQVLKHSWPEKLYNASSRQEVKVKRERYRMKYLGFLISLNTLTCFHTDLKYDVFHFKLLRDHQLCSFDCWESPKVWICKDQWGKNISVGEDRQFIPVKFHITIKCLTLPSLSVQIVYFCFCMIVGCLIN